MKNIIQKAGTPSNRIGLLCIFISLFLWGFSALIWNFTEITFLYRMEDYSSTRSSTYVDANGERRLPLARGRKYTKYKWEQSFTEYISETYDKKRGDGYFVSNMISWGFLLSGLFLYAGGFDRMTLWIKTGNQK